MDKSFLESLGSWSELLKDLDPQMINKLLENVDPQTLGNMLDGILNLVGSNPDGIKNLIKNFLP